MIGHLRNVTLLIALSTGAAVGQSPMSCVTELAVPRFHPTVMSFAPATGAIFVTVGQTGEAASVRFDSKNKLLDLELENTFRYGARYSPTCAGMTLSFTVSYVVLKKEPEANPVAAVTFQAPNRFVLEFAPMKPIRDRHQSGNGDFH
jgi:hypothetical protein